MQMKQFRRSRQAKNESTCTPKPLSNTTGRSWIIIASWVSLAVSTIGVECTTWVGGKIYTWHTLTASTASVYRALKNTIKWLAVLLSHYYSVDCNWNTNTTNNRCSSWSCCWSCCRGCTQYDSCGRTYNSIWSSNTEVQTVNLLLCKYSLNLGPSTLFYLYLHHTE